MKTLHAAAALFVLAVLLAVPAAQAQATRTWVSGVGDDANPCSRTAPCKTFPGAISKTAAGGEISVLDNGSYGAVTITKSLTINGDGSLAGVITSPGFNAIVVNAGANDRVVLRNIAINGLGTALNGIRFIAGKSLLVDNVTISGFTNRGIDMSMGTTSKLVVRDTRIQNVGTGVFVSTANGFLAQASLEGVHLVNSTNGLEGGANSRVTVSRSVISANASNGVLSSTATSRVNVEGCQISFNDVAGVNASVSGAIIRISNNEIYNNNTGILVAAGATVESSGNNRNQGNITDGAPNGTINLD